ncbi:MAG TPA: DUF1015 domain-containing protein [Candidatus Omnitrophota bacterium]|nr:DUF1015 domain-containing protein [Candidatus Omnitrophota bacterium]
MATIQPFQALRFNTSKVALEDVMAPPYDVISPSEQDALYARSDYNTVRLILGRQNDSDHASDNRYTRAKTSLSDWIQKGVLSKDDRPAFYLYEQIFGYPSRPAEKKTRMALFARIRLEEFSEGNILPHERTYSKPKADRLALLNATETSLSPVFGLYEDADGELRKLFGECRKNAPSRKVENVLEASHRLWEITDPAAVRKISALFEKKKIVIADGHHRYETAVNHRNESGVDPRAEHFCNYTLIALVESEDPGLLVLPTHRIVRKIKEFGADRFLQALKPYFEVREIRRDELLRFTETREGARKEFAFSFEDGKCFLAGLKDFSAVESLMPKGKSRAWCELEVSLVTHAVIEKILGLEESSWHDGIVYSHSAEEVFRKMPGGEFSVAIFLRGISVSGIFEVCKMKELLPHKSTYFYPKLPSGLVFYPHRTTAS